MPTGKYEFDVKHGDEWIRVSIHDEVAEFVVIGIDKVEIVIEALNRAAAAGGIRGTMFTNDMIEDHSAAMHRMRAQAGVTWLGGKVSLLGERPLGPMFRIDWDVLPVITE